MSADAAMNWLAEHEGESLERLKQWLRIPSVSTDPAYKEDCRRAAEWAARALEEAGLEAEILETGDPGKGTSGHPVVLATCEGDADYRGPHVLFYGHYDVQPADPLEQWESGPFEPVIKPAEPSGPGERIVARGAVDDKGQVAMFLESLRAWREVSGKPGGGVKFTVLLEGEEECASANLDRFVVDNRERFSGCDVCLISDTGMLDRERPAITYGLRGLVYVEIKLTGPNADLHSGLWGGRCLNPNNELARILGGLWDEKRRVTVPGFYDDVRDLTEGEREEWRGLGLDVKEMLAGAGLPPEADCGEEGYTGIEREWARPTAEINGIWGGYTGAGSKTIIPSHASAKLSFRLVPDQDPDRIETAFFDWLRARTPPGFSWEFASHGKGYPVAVQTDSPALAATGRAIERATGVRPALIKSGGTIPVTGILRHRAGLESILMGFGLADDRVHSPNEKFELECFRKGARSHACLIEELKKMRD